jgi:hypothetical protein
MEAGSDHFGFDFHQAKARKHYQNKCCKLSSTFILWKPGAIVSGFRLLIFTKRNREPNVKARLVNSSTF